MCCTTDWPFLCSAIGGCIILLPHSIASQCIYTYIIVYHFVGYNTLLLMLMMVSHGVILYPIWSIIDSDHNVFPSLFYISLSLSISLFLSMCGWPKQQTRLIFYPPDFHYHANNAVVPDQRLMGIETR